MSSLRSQREVVSVVGVVKPCVAAMERRGAARQWRVMPVRGKLFSTAEAAVAEFDAGGGGRR